MWKVSLLASALGLFTRASTTWRSGWAVLLGLPHNFGKTHHFDALVVLVLGVMMLARAGDAYSLDRRFFARGPAPAPSGEYRWPVRAAWLLMSLVFCSAGFAKLRNGGSRGCCPTTWRPCCSSTRIPWRATSRCRPSARGWPVSRAVQRAGAGHRRRPRSATRWPSSAAARAGFSRRPCAVARRHPPVHGADLPAVRHLSPVLGPVDRVAAAVSARRRALASA
jgi:hypothetical protein